MIEIRSANALGTTQNDWLEARHHFCFARYQHPDRMNWGRLRVLNHNILAPAAAPVPHPHDNMEMISYVRRGMIEHSGSFGRNHRTPAGEVQLISAGTGITHADCNPGKRPAEYLDIWILPDTPGGEPRRQTAKLPRNSKPGELITIASGFPDDQDGMTLRASARVMAAVLPVGSSVSYSPRPGRRIYATCVAGRVEIGSMRLDAGDGAAIMGEAMISASAIKSAEIILIDVP